MRRYSTMNDVNWDAFEVIHRLGLSHIGEFGHKAYLAKVLDMKRRLLFYFICIMSCLRKVTSMPFALVICTSLIR